MDELATKLVDSLTKVENALETMAPTAFQALVEAAYLTGVVDLVWGVMWACIVIVCGLLVRHGILQKEHSVDYRMSFIGPGGVGVFIAFIGVAVNMGTGSTWLKILNPTAYVIKSLLNQ